MTQTSAAKRRLHHSRVGIARPLVSQISAAKQRFCGVFHSRDDCAPLFRPPRGSAIRNLGGSILRHDPNFSRGAAFYLYAMAALLRESDPDGAASLPWQTIALACGGASRECGTMTLPKVFVWLGGGGIG